MNIRRAILIPATLIAALACAQQAPPKPVKKVGIRGVVKDLWFAQNKSRPDQMLVHGRLEADTDVDKALVTVNSATKVFRLKGGRRAEAAAKDLKKGVRIEITFTGPVMESYPVQATADEIIILPAKR